MALLAEDTVARLQALQQSQTLKIIEFRDLIHPNINANEQKRDSGVSEASVSGFENQTPADLESELVHYKELFSKLRFSYVEQVTKEKFLRHITSEFGPPEITSADNASLEIELGKVKASLKAQKVEVADLIQQLEARGRDLSKRYEVVHLKSTRLQELPPKIQELEANIELLKASVDASTNTNRLLSMSLPATLEAVEAYESELSSLDAQIAALQAQVPRKQRELAKLENELRPLEERKSVVVCQAREARRRREEGGGMGDEVEERGRWYRAVDTGLRSMLEIES